MQAKRLSFTYSAYLKTDEDRNLIGIFIPPAKVTYSRLLKTCDIGCLTAIYDTEKLGKIYMPTLRKRQDYGLWLKIFKQIRETEGLHNEALAYYRIRSNSVSNNKFAAAQFHFRILREIGEVSFIRACYNFMFYLINGIIKHIK
jgi:hypothetical protein